MYGTMKDHVGIERWFNFSCVGRADFLEGHTSITQYLQTGLHHLAVPGRAQQHHVAIAAFIVQFQSRGNVVQPLPAVERQTLKLRAMRQIGIKFAGTIKLPHPDQIATGQRQADLDRCVTTQQMPQDLARHAGRCPWRDVSRCDQARVGKAGFLGGSTPALQYTDLMAVAGQLVGRCHANNAGANDCNLHEFLCSNLPHPTPPKSGLSKQVFNFKRYIEHLVVLQGASPNHQANR